MAWNNDADQVALVEQVEYMADQLLQDGQTIGANREFIYQALERASREIIRAAPAVSLYEALSDGTSYANTNLTLSATKLTIPLPSGPTPPRFLRFLRLECTHLSTPIEDLLNPKSDDYRVQQNQYARADIITPKAFLVPQAAAPNFAIEVYPGTTSANPVSSLLYVGQTDPEDLPEILEKALVEWGAAVVLRARRRYEESGIAMQSAAASLLNVKVGFLGEDQAPESS